MSCLSKMNLEGVHDRSSGPYPSQSTRYWRPRPRRRQFIRRRTVNVSTPSMMRGGGGLGGVETRGDVTAGFNLDTCRVDLPHRRWESQADGRGADDS